MNKYVENYTHYINGKIALDRDDRLNLSGVNINFVDIIYRNVPFVF